MAQNPRRGDRVVFFSDTSPSYFLHLVDGGKVPDSRPHWLTLLFTYTSGIYVELKYMGGYRKIYTNNNIYNKNTRDLVLRHLSLFFLFLSSRTNRSKIRRSPSRTGKDGSRAKAGVKKSRQDRASLRS